MAPWHMSPRALMRTQRSTSPVRRRKKDREVTNLNLSLATLADPGIHDHRARGTLFDQPAEQHCQCRQTYSRVSVRYRRLAEVTAQIRFVGCFSLPTGTYLPSFESFMSHAVIIDRGHRLDLDKLIVGLQNEFELITRHGNAGDDLHGCSLTHYDQRPCHVPCPGSFPTNLSLRTDPAFSDIESRRCTATRIHSAGHLCRPFRSSCRASRSSRPAARTVLRAWMMRSSPRPQIVSTELVPYT
jgi:hypothetical protein